MQNPHCHFSMDEPIGSFSPVQGVVLVVKNASDRIGIFVFPSSVSEVALDF